MKYPDVFYKTTQHLEYMEHYSFDGTYRGVLFRSAVAAQAALMVGRAEVDCSAIEQGFLPRGAYLVSRAGDVEPVEPSYCYAQRSARSETTRVRFAVGVPRPGSEYITEERDEAARSRNPAGARRYEALVDAVEQASRTPKP